MAEVYTDRCLERDWCRHAGADRGDTKSRGNPANADRGIKRNIPDRQKPGHKPTGGIQRWTPLQTLQDLPGNSTTSMQRDIAEGKPSELGVQTDAVIRLAKDTGVETPVNRYILHSLRPLELRARGALNF